MSFTATVFCAVDVKYRRAVRKFGDARSLSVVETNGRFKPAFVNANVGFYLFYGFNVLKFFDDYFDEFSSFVASRST